MSQFILCRGDLNGSEIISELKIIPLTQNHTFLWHVAHKIFQQLETVEKLWFFSLQENEDFDMLFTQAQHDIYSGKSLEETLLGKFLSSAFDSIDEIVMWYANDWEDLTLVYDKKEFLFLVKEGIEEPMCEAYLKYIRRDVVSTN
jgi:hypothetical protein